MKQEKAKMRRVGGFLLEILILVFVFSYSHSGSEISAEEQSSQNQNAPAAQFLLGDFNIPASHKEDLVKMAAFRMESLHIDFTPAVIQLVKSQFDFSFTRVYFYFSNTTINAP